MPNVRLIWEQPLVALVVFGVLGAVLFLWGLRNDLRERRKPGP